MSKTDIKNPRGKLIAIGGKEARSSKDGMLAGSTREPGHDGGSILTHVLAEIKGPASRIEILTTASEEPSEMADMYIEAFQKLGCDQVGILNLDGRNVDSQQTLQRLAAADGLFMTGGDQTRLIGKIGGSDFLKSLKRRYQEDDFTLIGTSAGAMAMSEVMIDEGESTESLQKGIVSLSRGFNFLPQTVIDIHFMSRGRFARLAEALLMHKGMTALGICEDTALVIGDGGIARVVGSGIVMVLEAEHVRSTNFKEAKKGEAIFVEGMQIHILASGAMYSLPEKKFMLSTQPQ